MTSIRNNLKKPPQKLDVSAAVNYLMIEWREDTETIPYKIFTDIYGVVQTTLSAALYVILTLKSIVSSFAGTNLDNILNIINKYLAVADIACVKDITSRLYNAVNRNG